MIESRCGDAQVAQVESLTRSQIAHTELGRNVINGNRKKGWRHLLFESSAQVHIAVGTAHHIDAIARHVQRRKEGQALDVIPVQVREQDDRVGRPRTEEAVA